MTATLPAVHQFIPNVEPGAVAAHTRVARDLLRSAGHRSEIFTSDIHAECSDWGAHAYADYGRSQRAHSDDVLVYQMAIGSVVADFLLGRAERLIVNHHNLTPLRYFDGWEPSAAHGVAWGRHQLRALADRADLGVAVSMYNEADLIEAGFRTTRVVPFLMEVDALASDADPETIARMQATPGPRWLFVGRLAPNKAQQDLVKAFVAYRRFYDTDATLHIVGAGLDGRFGRALRDFVDAAGLGTAVTFTGPVGDRVLAAYYATADVYVSTSEHEGFCVPLVEAMRAGVPVVAFGAAAVPETVADAGLLVDRKDPATVAAAVNRVVTDVALRRELVARGRTRAQSFDVSITGPDFVAAVTSARTGR